MKTPCPELQDQILEMVSNFSPEFNASAVIEHLNRCEGCREYYFALYQEHLALTALAFRLEEPRRQSVDRAMNLLPEQTTYSFWRKIMQKKIIPFAAAALVVFAVGMTLYFVSRTASEAYALQQTVDAMKKAEVVHILGRDWQERKIELWIKMNLKTSKIDSCRIEETEKGIITVCTPEKTYIYDKKTNKVEIPIGSGVYSDFFLLSFFEYMEQMTRQLNGKMTTEYKYDSELIREVIVVDVKSDMVNIRYVVDRETKLPLRVTVLKGTKSDHFSLMKNAELITYGEVHPANIFEFQIPAGAQVIDQHIISTISPIQVLSPAVISWIMKFDANALKNAGITKPIRINTQVRIVDRQLRLTTGGVGSIPNSTGKPLSEEIEAGGYTYSNVEMYDVNGVKQKTRLAKTLFRNNHYTLYMTPNPPIAPGEVRQIIWVIGQARPLSNNNPERLYYFDMENYFGQEVLESFVLVVPAQMIIKMQTEAFTRKEQVGDVDIYVWQKHVPGSENHAVQVGLKVDSPVR
jgi:hypothetical protein